jgi:hypothetical protein
LTHFSSVESFTLFASGVAAVAVVAGYYGTLAGATRVGRRGGVGGLLALAAAPPIGLATLVPVLARAAAREVRAEFGYALLFGLAGVGWIGFALPAGSLLGVDFKGDAVDRRNRAAAIALAGAVLGLTCAYAGANVGEGATIWTTFGPAALATLAWAGAWAALERLTGIGDAIAIGRDLGAGARLAVFLLVAGVTCGYAAAGDYVGAVETLADFGRRAWPLAPLVALAAVAERVSRGARS